MNSSLIAHPNSRRDSFLVAFSLFALYIIWGSTYFGIRIGVQSFPPFFMNAIRFTVAGAILYAVLRARGTQHPNKLEWSGAFRIGLFLIIGGNTGTTLAESLGVASGLAATIVATMPLWAALWSTLWGQRPRLLEVAGMLVGLIGVIILSREGNLQGNPIGAIVMFIAPIFWSFGSIWSKHLTLPQGLMASATEMLTAGLLMIPISFVLGERMTKAPSPESLLALLYLITFGSLIAFSAYLYLLSKVRPTLATSYAYVNPIVAVLLGMFFGQEEIGINAFIAMPIILSAVGLVAYAQNQKKATT
jgi:drug/metabolite transporter (DMT)-like permease